MISKKIELLENYIVENETLDNDFWVFAGNDALQNMLLDFSIDEWENLKKQSKNWTSHQLSILADSLIDSDPKLAFDVNQFYGEIFTRVEDSEADYLIQHIKVIDDERSKPIELLISIKERIRKLKTYTEHIHNVHNYEDYLIFIDRMIQLRH